MNNAGPIVENGNILYRFLVIPLSNNSLNIVGINFNVMYNTYNYIIPNRGTGLLFRWSTKLMFIVGLFCLISSISGQNLPLERYYLTQRVKQRLIGEFADYNNNISTIERNIKEKTTIGNFKKVTIPIVFHIIYSANQPYPTTEQIWSQIDALNRDFGAEPIIPVDKEHPAYKKEKFDQVKSNTEIEFCLAVHDQTKQTGVVLINSNTLQWEDNDHIKQTQTGGSSPWDPVNYLNVWVADLKDFAGYAQMPGGPVNTDGIVIDYQYFGTMGTAVFPFNSGKTLTHLVGSYLGLHELWNEYEYCADDYVDDTPIHNAPNYYNTEYKHVSTCGDNPVEMTMNFMDAMNDEDVYIFSQGQKIRLQAMLSENGPRYGLLSKNKECEKQKKNLGELPTLSSSAFKLYDFEVNVYPNPSSPGIVNVIINSQYTGNSTLTVINAAGRQLLRQEHLLSDGINTFQLNLQYYVHGYYFIRLETPGTTVTKKVILN